MLERILDIQGIGLLHQANGKPHTCRKATLIYSDNGRGKSTLASILRSVSVGDASLVNNRKTIDGTLEPKVHLQFDSGHPVSFNDGAWSEHRPEVRVFDADFIERNVHSGGTVSTNHRKNLLEFALGEAAVAARATLEKVTDEAKVATEKVQNLVAQLSGHHVGITLAQFEKLPVVDVIETKRIDLQKRINAANNVSVILGKAVPKVLVEPVFDINDMFEKLAISLEDIHEDAERIVKEHVATLKSSHAESWLSQGQQFNASESCPYCGQETIENTLIYAYKIHFNIAYSNLKAKISEINNAIIAATDPNIVNHFAQSIAAATAQATAWAEHAQILPITFDVESAHIALSSLQVLMLDLFRRKQASPAEPIGTEAEKAEATTLWDAVIFSMRNANLAIKAVAEVINIYKGVLVAENIQQLQHEVHQLQLTQRRYSAEVIDIINQLKVSQEVAKKAEKRKQTIRKNLDALMKTTLDQYEISINTLLKKFGASFTIKGMGSNFRGTAPRSEYGLLLRGKNVALEGGLPSFATALSEGDKRTLAFSFFVASTLADSKLPTQIIVIDDPMCSFDLNRKNHTKLVLKHIHAKANQMIVLAHDPYFVRDVRDTLLKEDKTAQIATFQLVHAQEGYTNFASLDVDKECESAYFRHHRLLNEFVAGNVADAKSVAPVIRPMLEGYLHRRFPGLLPKDLMFGMVVAYIRDKPAPSPLHHAHGLVDELNEINEYAGQFHHDTNPNVDTVTIVTTELKTFAERALNVIHKGLVTT